MEVVLFIVVMAVLYLLIFGRFGLLQHRVLARTARLRNMTERRPDPGERSNHHVG